MESLTLLARPPSTGSILCSARLPSPLRNAASTGLSSQRQPVYAFGDGALIRIKPKGDNFNPGRPMLHVEVKMVAPSNALPEQNGVAFKVDAKGNPVAKSPGDIKNPYDNGRHHIQHETFEQEVLKADHRQAKP